MWDTMQYPAPGLTPTNAQVGSWWDSEEFIIVLSHGIWELFVTRVKVFPQIIVPSFQILYPFSAYPLGQEVGKEDRLLVKCHHGLFYFYSLKSKNVFTIFLRVYLKRKRKRGGWRIVVERGEDVTKIACGMKVQKYLPSDLWQEKVANLCSRISTVQNPL